MKKSNNTAGPLTKAVFSILFPSLLLPFFIGESEAQPIKVRGYMVDRFMETEVDSREAAELFSLLNDSSFQAGYRAGALRGDGGFSEEGLERLAVSFSVDYATLIFINGVLSSSANRLANQEFLAILDRIRRGGHSPSGKNQEYKILFVPGFHYKSDRQTGADFSKPMKKLAESGFDVELIETLEDGGVAANAQIIVSSIRRHLGKQKKIILVSTSKGSTDASVALGGGFISESDVSIVKAWVSVGGILRGTYLADNALLWPKWWLAKFVLWIQGIDSSVVPELAVGTASPRFAKLRFPAGLLKVQYVAVPLSGQVSDDVRARYQELSPRGPNDGLTLLAHEIIPDSLIILEPGLDHYYRDPEIELKTLALTEMVMGKELE
ncbi:MAG: hypothetical protein HZA03_11360 [Nitrospinae bacterium]|nr:hypothetical protein [Nitrospinota bacterium]